METPPPPGTPPESDVGLEDLTRLLARQRFRMPPPAWREPILDGAIRAGMGSVRSVRQNVNPGVETGPGWWAWLRSGWAGVGAAWGLAWMLHVAVAPSQPVARVSVPLSAAAQAELAAQMAALSDVVPVAGAWAVVGPEPRHPARPLASPPVAPAIPGRPRAALRRTSIERFV